MECLSAINDYIFIIFFIVIQNIIIHIVNRGLTIVAMHNIQLDCSLIKTTAITTTGFPVNY